jgi:PPOX class probable F420-dependent enzyme
VNDDEIRAFLDRPLLGFVATLRRDGSPNAVPVWYRYDGAAVSIWTEERRGWVRNVLRDPRVSFVVAELEPPYAGVIVRGEAAVRTAPDDVTAREVRAITRRYIPADEVEEYVARWPGLDTIVTVRPSTLTGWTIGY